MRGLKQCCIPIAMDENDDNMLWKGSDEGGVLGVGVRKMKAY
jgi:hypothetical protein